jgi:acyl-phosphate glycerol 3-phosphate acyltransferase
MTAYALSTLAVALAYLIGAIPFAYLVVYLVKGVDIRTVGSGNVGATNAGRVLGSKYFFLVFLLDLLKGFLPTYSFPKAVAALAGSAAPGLAVPVALATILGHNFPIYLRFKGGKGVATSLGAMLALDWAASVASAATFVVFLLVTRIVSMSSVLGAIIFALVHFGLVRHPWSRDQAAMSVLTLGLVGMLIVRHRKNFARIAAGTEPKVAFRKPRPAPPSGRAGVFVVVGLVLVGGVAAWLALRGTRRAEAEIGPFRLVEVARAATGHQRAERVAFADGGRLLAVTCPRYNRVALYRVTEKEALERLPDIALGGRPVALAPARDRLYVLQRPEGDARHVEPGYWESFDFRGRPLGTRFLVGFYPDDMALTPDARNAVVLASGRAEGGPDRPAPALLVVDLQSADGPRVIGRLAFDGPRDDPERVVLSSLGTHAAVTLAGSNQVAAIELGDPARPRLAGRARLSRPGQSDAYPYLSLSGDESILLPVDLERETVAIAPPAGLTDPGRFLIATVPDGSAVEVVRALPRDKTPGQSTWQRPLGRLTLRGTANLGAIRPTGLAYAPGRGLLAVASRSGGVHLVAIRQELPEPGPIAASEGHALRR